MSADEGPPGMDDDSPWLYVPPSSKELIELQKASAFVYANGEGRFKGEPLIHIAIELSFKELANEYFNEMSYAEKWTAHPEFGTPFTHAFQKRQYDMAWNFWDLGNGNNTHVNGTNKRGHAPIHFAAGLDKVDFAETLIRFGADVNLQDNMGRTPLIYAASNHNKSPMIALLIEKGANANITDNTGMGPIHVATSSYLTFDIERSDPLHLNQLTVNSKSNITAEAIDTPVNFDAVNTFVAGGNVDIFEDVVVDDVIEKGADVFEAKSFGTITALQYMILQVPLTSKTVSAAINMMKRGAKSEARDKNGATFLHRAVHHSTISFAMDLAELTDVNAKDRMGLTPIFRLFLISPVTDNFKSIAGKLVEVGADLNINIPRIDGSFILHWAIDKMDKEKTRLLIDYGADVSIVSTDGTVPLHRALIKKDFDTAKMLLDAGADINFKCSNGNTLLYNELYAQLEEFELATWLINHGILLDVLNAEGHSHLYAASNLSRGPMDMINLLIDKGADIFLAGPGTAMPFHLLARRELDVERWEKISAMTTKAQIDLADTNGNTFVHQLAMHVSDVTIWRLFTDKITIDVQNDRGQTPLHLAIRKTNANVIDLLLSMGFQVNIPDKAGLTPIHYVVHYLNLKVLRQFISKDPNFDLNLRGKEGRTLLMFALSRRSQGVPLVKYLITEREVNLDIMDANGRTALGRLVETHDPSTNTTKFFVKMLLSAGANLRLGFPDGKEPVLHFLVKMKEPAEALSLLEKGANVHTLNNEKQSLLYAAMAKYLDGLVIELLNRGVDIHKGFPYGVTPLGFATFSNLSLSVIEALIEKGADVHALDSSGRSLIRMAVFRRRLDLVRLFLDNEVSIFREPGFRRSVLRQAVDYVTRHWPDISIVEALLDAGADPNDATVIPDKPDNKDTIIEPDNPDDPNVNREYVLNVAVKNQRLDLVQLLLDRGASQINLDQALLKPETPAMVSIRKEFDAWGKVSSLKNTALRALRRSGEFYKLRAGLRLSSFGPTQKRLEEERKKRERRITSMSVPPQTTTSSSSFQPTTSSSSSQAATSSFSSRATTSSSSSQPAPSSLSTLNAPGSSSSQTTTSSSSDSKGKKRSSENEGDNSQKRQKAQIQMQIKAAFKACRSGNVALVSSLLQKEPTLINAKLRDGTTLYDYFLRHNKKPLRLELSKV